MTDEDFRELLDEQGLLRHGVLAAPERRDCYAVFAQRPDIQLDMDELRHHAVEFFGTSIGATVDKRYGGVLPDVDAARIVIFCTMAKIAGTRLCYGRRADASDHDAAEQSELAIGTYGLALLARRCKALWLILPDGGEEDRAALTIAAIFASAHLGPILVPGGREIIGVRSARAKLEGRPSPYR